jgi:hypothetical protein
MAFSITTLSTMPLSTRDLFVTLSISIKRHYAGSHYAEGYYAEGRYAECRDAVRPVSFRQILDKAENEKHTTICQEI